MMIWAAGDGNDDRVTLEELKALLSELRQRATELEDVEAKSAHAGTPEDLELTLCAFSNRHGGGTLLFGLEPRRYAVVGVGDPDRLQRDLAAAATNLEPPARVALSAHVLDGQVVMVAEVPEVAPEFRPAFVRTRGPYRGAYVRVGDGDRQMTEYEVYLALVSRTQPAEDVRRVEEATLADLDQTALARFTAVAAAKHPAVAALAGDDRMLLLRSLGVVTREDPPTPTLAGLIVFGRYPQQFFPSLVITVTAYASDRPDASARLEADVRCEGPVVTALEEALRTSARLMRSRIVVVGLLHDSVPEYPAAVMREALVNAVAHRDYSRYATGTQVQVRFFPDRVEIQNPGGLYGALPIELLGDLGVQSTRNAALARLLEDLGPMENRGTGLATMASGMGASSLAPPEFVDGTTYFRVTLRNASLLDEATLTWLAGFEALGLSDRQRFALAFLRRFHRITNREYRLLGQPDSRQAARELRDLVSAGILDQHGLRGGTHYRLAVTAQQPAADGLDARAAAVLAALERDGPLGTAALIRQTALPRVAVHQALGVLLDRGLVAPTTATKRSPQRKYRVVPRPD